jgi:hypothetical protein
MLDQYRFTRTSDEGHLARLRFVGDYRHAFSITDAWFRTPLVTEAEWIVVAEAAMWCRDQFGEEGDRWQQHRHSFFFASRRDAAAFKLRWC